MNMKVIMENKIIFITNLSQSSFMFFTFLPGLSQKLKISTNNKIMLTQKHPAINYPMLMTEAQGIEHFNNDMMGQSRQ